MEITNEEVMVSFEVVSLFTAIPVNKACSYIRNKLDKDITLHSSTNLITDDIISLLEFVLSNNYFVFIMIAFINKSREALLVRWWRTSAWK